MADLLNNRNPSIILNSSKPDEDEYEGKFNPTFLELEGKFRNGGIEIPVNGSRPVATKTDAANDYFHRSNTTGYLYISDDEIEKCFCVGRSLKDGRLTVYFALHTDTYMELEVRFSFDIGPHDPSMPLPLKVPYNTNRYGRRRHDFLIQMIIILKETSMEVKITGRYINKKRQLS